MLGHVNDPRMNTEEKGYGILSTSQLSKTGCSKQILYLKDEVSRFYTFGTPVTFDIQKRKILYDDQELQQQDQQQECNRTSKPVDNSLKFIEIEIATNVRVCPERIKEHKVVRRLNTMSEAILTKDFNDEMLGCLNFLMKMEEAMKDDEDPSIF
jgi:hypothetical protein